MSERFDIDAGMSETWLRHQDLIVAEAREARQGEFPYVWFWKRLGRKGQRCRVICRGTMNSALLEFEDGFRTVTSRNGLRKAS